MSLGRKLRGFVTHNLALKLASLVLSFLVWVAIASAPLAEVAFNVPLEFHNVPDGLEVASENFQQVQVRIRGSENLLRQVQSQDIHVNLDLASFGHIIGERTFDLSSAQIKLPPNVEIVQIVPSSVRLDFDLHAAKLVPVRPRIVGIVAAGSQIAGIIVEPPRVAIVGPQGHVAGVEAAMTDPVDVSGISGRHTFVTVPYVPDPLVRLQQPSNVRVTVVTGTIVH